MAKNTAAILTKIVKQRMKNSPVVLSDIGAEIADIAKQIGEKPKDVADVLIPIYRQATEESLTKGAIKKSARKGYDHRHYGHGH